MVLHKDVHQELIYIQLGRIFYTFVEPKSSSSSINDPIIVWYLRQFNPFTTYFSEITGSSEYGNEQSTSIKTVNFFTRSAAVSFRRMVSVILSQFSMLVFNIILPHSPMVHLPFPFRKLYVYNFDKIYTFIYDYW